MELGNRYGINMGNILSTASALKTAKLKQNKAQREEDRDLAGIKLRKNALAKKNNVQLENSLASEKEAVGEDKSNVLGDMVTTDKKSSQVKPTRNKMELLSDADELEANALAPKVATELKDTAQKEADIASMTKFFQKSGASLQEAELRARGYSARIDTFNENLRKSKDYEKKEMREASAQQAQYWDSMMSEFKDNPELVQKKYADKRTEMIETISKLNASSDPRVKAEADRLQKIYDAQPPEFSMDFAGVSLAEATQKVTLAEDYLKSVVAEQKAEADKQKAETLHMNEKPSVITFGDKDIKLTPKKQGYKTEEKTSNALLKEQEKNKGGAGGFKTSDFSLVEKIAIRNTTGLDLDNPDDMAKFADLSQEQRDVYTDLSARASRIYKDGGGKITHAEAVKKAAKEKSNKKAPVEGTLYKKGGVVYKIVNGKPVKQ